MAAERLNGVDLFQNQRGQVIAGFTGAGGGANVRPKAARDLPN
jgi:hypothetical protein